MYCWANLQSVHGFRCYDNIAPNAKCQRVLVLAICHVLSVGKTEQEGRDFRLYDLEVLELSSDVSFLLVLPPVEAVCNSPFDGQDQQSLSSRECTYVPVQAFEMCKCFAIIIPNSRYS